MADYTNLKFSIQIKVRDTKPENEKWVKRGRGLSHVTYFSNYGIPTPNISGMAEDTNFKFCTLSEGKRY